MSEYSIYICLQYTNTQFEACFNTEIFNLTKIKKLSDKVIPKRIYVILNNLILSNSSLQISSGNVAKYLKKLSQLCKTIKTLILRVFLFLA